MKRFDKAQLAAFLHALDRHLRSRVELVVIGGAAATLAYGASTRTADIDIYELRSGDDRDIGRAAEKAREETGLAVAVTTAPVAELPYGYETRLKVLRGLAFAQLAIMVPDKYDLALSKALRAYPHDLDAIEDMHRRHRMAPKTLVERFERELMNGDTADKRKIQLNLAMVAARLYGFEMGCRLAERWGLPVPGAQVSQDQRGPALKPRRSRGPRGGA